MEFNPNLTYVIEHFYWNGLGLYVSVLLVCNSDIRNIMEWKFLFLILSFEML
jgi:hypothetical protein